MKLKKEIVVAALFTLGSTSAMADNVGNCGWGSKLFDGQSGLFPQVLAVTTNGTSGNQTFAITSGTSGCTQDGTVSSSWKTAMYIDGNKAALARATAAGQGEALSTLAAVIGIPKQDQADFARLAQQNFAGIFPSADASTDHIIAALRSAIEADSKLSKYATAI